VRAGAWVPLIWAGLLVVLGTINAIWTDVDLIQSGTFLAAIGDVLALAVLLVGLSPQALHRGAPEAVEDPEALPSMSAASMIAGLAFGTFVFGFAFGKFPIFFGGGLLLLAAGRLAVEVRAQRSALARVREQHPREPSSSSSEIPEATRP
jgi:hypothetical protein